MAAGAFLAAGAFFLGSFLAAAPILNEALTLTNWWESYGKVLGQIKSDSTN